uniref:Carotenoid 9,10(9',10')-cleavage dioxygenase 1-like n=1 Tax=Davidia involucrata TaxID=16924 RepID=A0A5B7CCU4_DAVIN
MATIHLSSHVKGSVHKRFPQRVGQLKTSLSSTVKPFLQELEKIPMRINVSKTVKSASLRLLDAFVDSVFQFVDQPVLPSQRNFAPVEEIGEIVQISCVEGEIPEGFPEGVYIRNGANPLFGGLKSTISMFGRSNHVWVEGEGMLHALYFTKDADGNWSFAYNNRFVESETFKMEKQRNKPSFLPAVEGDSLAILAAFLLNVLRFGDINKILSNTSVFEHAGKYYSIAENYLAQEIDISTLQTLSNWELDGAWGRPFTTHPKKAPGTGELVIMGVDAVKPYYVVGVISADGRKLIHKVDINLKRSILSHEIGVTEKYNTILDYPLIVDAYRLFQGGPLIKYEKEKDARIGVMPRYGDADSIKWFEVESYCTFHILNCFEDGDEVVVRGCKAKGAIIPGPEWGQDKFEWFSRGFKPLNSIEENTDNSTADGLLFACVYEWRLNMKTDEVKERNLSGTEFSMDFPMINEDFTGVKHKYGYTQVIDSEASSSCGKSKYGGLAKLHFDKPKSSSSVPVKVEYHKFAKNNFCTGSTFVSKPEAVEEDDGWIVAFVHNEDTDVSQVIVVDAKKFEDEPIAKIPLPQRVPYGHHGAYFATPRQH